MVKVGAVSWSVLAVVLICKWKRNWVLDSIECGLLRTRKITPDATSELVWSSVLKSLKLLDAYN